MYKIKKCKVKKSVRRKVRPKSRPRYYTIIISLLNACYSTALTVPHSDSVCNDLKRFSLIERRVLTSFLDDNGLSPLHTACYHGHVRIVEFIIKECGPNLEQLGVFKRRNGSVMRNITPLWFATAGGQLEVMSILLNAGADINCVDDHGRTPVWLACSLLNWELSSYLIGRGADINRPDNDGKTCLMCSVLSKDICAVLLHHHVDVNARDSSLKTALHYAIGSPNIHVIKLLLEYGADPLLRCENGYNVLHIIACEGSIEIMPVLQWCLYAHYSPLDIINLYELLAASCIEKFTHEDFALRIWYQLTSIRNRYNCLPKEPVTIPYDLFKGVREWNTIDELKRIMINPECIRTQALLVALRILGPNHPSMINRIIIRGVKAYNSFHFRDFIGLWNWALQLMLRKKPLIEQEPCTLMIVLTTVMMKVHMGELWISGSAVPWHVTVLRVYTVVVDNIQDARARLAVVPSAGVKKAKNAFERVIHCLTHLIYLLVKTASTDEEMNNVVVKVHELMAADIRSPRTRNSLLHLCVTTSNVIPHDLVRPINLDDMLDKSNGETQSVFPDLDVVRVLVSYDRGRAVHARNIWGCTPLHVACSPANYAQPVVEALLAAGAHLDTPNRFGFLPKDKLPHIDCHLDLFSYISLACLAANVCATFPRSVLDKLPPLMREFIDLHSTD